MANQNQKVVENKTEQVETTQQVETPVQAEPQNAPQKQTPAEEPKGFGTWLKKHWKGVTAGITGVGAAVGSAILAYKKGKQAGVNSVPVMEQEDYSLNPNE